MEQLANAIPSIISGILMMALGGLIGLVSGFIIQTRKWRKEHKELMSAKADLAQLIVEHGILMESQRNQLKAQIVRIYERAKERGYITHMELDTMNRLADSYFALGGNHYIHAVVKKANAMPVGGEAIPIDGDE